MGALEGGIVHEEVDCAERIDRFLGYILANSSVANVSGQKDGFATRFGN
jgi:hypothetical protein